MLAKRLMWIAWPAFWSLACSKYWCLAWWTRKICNGLDTPWHFHGKASTPWRFLFFGLWQCSRVA